MEFNFTGRSNGRCFGASVGSERWDGDHSGLLSERERHVHDYRPATCSGDRNDPARQFFHSIEYAVAVQLPGHL